MQGIVMSKRKWKFTKKCLVFSLHSARENVLVEPTNAYRFHYRIPKLGGDLQKQKKKFVCLLLWIYRWAFEKTISFTVPCSKKKNKACSFSINLLKYRITDVYKQMSPTWTSQFLPRVGEPILHYKLCLKNERKNDA